MCFCSKFENVKCLAQTASFKVGGSAFNHTKVQWWDEDKKTKSSVSGQQQKGRVDSVPTAIPSLRRPRRCCLSSPEWNPNLSRRFSNIPGEISPPIFRSVQLIEKPLLFYSSWIMWKIRDHRRVYASPYVAVIGMVSLSRVLN